MQPGDYLLAYLITKLVKKNTHIGLVQVVGDELDTNVHEIKVFMLDGRKVYSYAINLSLSHTHNHFEY